MDASTPASTTALRLAGRDALAVLHRVSTQKLDDLAPGQARTTLFCDFRGRLLHRATVALAHDGSTWLLRDDAPGDDLAAFVDRAVFREDVRIEDLSRALAVRLVFDESGGAARFVPAGEPHFVPESAGFALVVGEPVEGTVVDEPARVARGRARHGREIAEAFTPYEVNLADHVHLAKGCYTGQETLQRLFTYDSVRRRLVGFSGTGVPPAPQDVLADGEVAGRLTSAASAGGRWGALAVVRIDALARGAAFALTAGAALGTPHEFPVPAPLGRH